MSTKTAKQATKEIEWGKIRPDLKRISAKSGTRPALISAYNDGTHVNVTDTHVALRIEKEAITGSPIGPDEGIDVHTGEEMKGSYPELRRLFPTSDAKSEITLDKSQVNEMKKAFERMGVLVKSKKNHPVKWAVYGETAKLSVYNEEDGSTANDVVDHGKHANFHEVHVNYKLINNVLTFAKKTMVAGDEITVKFYGQHRPILIEGNAWQALVLPIRMY